MRKVLYTKFSRERRNEFQIMTRITEEAHANWMKKNERLHFLL